MVKFYDISSCISFVICRQVLFP